jgi:hypothetical protein
MLPPGNSVSKRERFSSMNITIEKIQPEQIRTTKTSRLKLSSLHKQYKQRSSAHTTGESTCESSGVSMHCISEDFLISDIEKSEEYRSGQSTSTTCGPLSSLQPSSASEASAMTTCDESEAIYYFGYGPIVNPIVRYRRGCMIPPEQIRTAILYDHRLKFVAGGTANVVATRGWDVKGVLLRFNSKEEWQAFKQYDANYDVREISVSVIDKTNLDPKNKNDHTAPFEDCGDDQADAIDLDGSDRSETLIRSRMHKSMLVGAGGSSSLNSLENSDSDEEDYSCPFSFEPKSKKADPNAVKCFTFVINQPNGAPRHTISENAPYRGSNGGSASVVGKPQERYLKLMTDGLRGHDIDETYIHDEVLSVNYIPNERDKVTDQSNYKAFPSAKKLSKVNFQKYETKLCKAQDNATHFVIGSNIMRVDEGANNIASNPCLSWFRLQAHGKGDITFLVHQTFVDKECLHVPIVDKPEDLTEQHQKWAEHVLFLYLERGGLTATIVAELSDSSDSSSSMFSRFKKKSRTERASLPEINVSASSSGVHPDGTMSAGFNKKKSIFGRKR